ncbi:hypothetical protein ACM66B_005648 [Microbotryomycetes sp. NB124-2]
MLDRPSHNRLNETAERAQGEAYSTERRHQIARIKLIPGSLAPADMPVGSDEWQDWLLALDEGINLIHSASARRSTRKRLEADPVFTLARSRPAWNGAANTGSVSRRLRVLLVADAE